jgi:hypothetical protein
VKQVVAPAPGRFALFHRGGATVHIADVAAVISKPTRNGGVLACSYGRPASNLMFSLDGGRTWRDPWRAGADQIALHRRGESKAMTPTFTLFAAPAGSFFIRQP